MSDGFELLRKVGVVMFWAGALAGTVGYAWWQLRATAVEGGPPPPDERGRRVFQSSEARGLARRARVCSVLGALCAVGAIVLMALRQRAG
ncbi:MAG: hypothetical protein IRZ16_14340 [Myxococcaceae bacterium]|nr:hypothetical protein [Myxococcaceae bacterium]